MTINGINDWRREVVTRYYGKLIARHGWPHLKRKMARLKPFLWNPNNLEVVEAHL